MMEETEIVRDNLAAFAIHGANLIIVEKMIALSLGFMTIYLGYKLIREGVTGAFKFSVKYEGWAADLRSLSPGLLFVLLGIAFMAIAVLDDNTVTLEYPPRNAEPLENGPKPVL